MDEKFNKRFTSFCNSLDALAEAKQRDLSDSFVLKPFPKSLHFF